MDEHLLRRAREKFKALLAAERALHEKMPESPSPPASSPQMSLDDVYDLINLADDMLDD
jgi:hypothetical protein